MMCRDQDKQHKPRTGDCMSKCERTGSSVGKWTAGPWEVVNSTGVYTALGATNAEGIKADNCDGWNVAETGDVSFTFVDDEVCELSYEERVANAHLIASAPELYEALAAMTQAYADLVNCGDCGNWNPETDSEVIEARRVLAKARGKSDD